MNYTEVFSRYVAHFVDELANSGLKHVVISPGSRSTPLAMTMCEHKEINEWITVDERSAAYFALGMAKQTKVPVALICTSGTAAANYFPAIIEARYNRVPLVILTADRPHELRDVGAPQAIDQIKMYGNYVKWFQEMPLPEVSEEMLAFARTTANRAVQIAKEGNAGPVHLNFPFREPLTPDFSIDNLWGSLDAKPTHTIYNGVKTVSEREIETLLQKLDSKRKGMIVCGPQEDPALVFSIAKLAQKWGLPILADPLSQLRAGKHCKDYIIENYDAIFRSEQIHKQLKPDFIIRFGAMPVSKFYSFFIASNKDVLHVVIEPNEGFRQPTKQPTHFIYADPIQFIQTLLNSTGQKTMNRNWLNRWLTVNEIATKHVQINESNQITEGVAVRSLLEVIPTESILYVGNSMAVRDLDTFFLKTDKQISVLANRGASGIEGMISSALGVAATTNKHVTLLIGDLSFYHDLNGLLLAKQYDLNLTILLVNNNGGGIFSFLPQADHKKYFESLFGTPLNIHFQHAVKMYEGIYELATDTDDLKNKLANSYHVRGLKVIEVRTDREENMKWHRKIWNEIEKDILTGE